MSERRSSSTQTDRTASVAGRTAPIVERVGPQGDAFEREADRVADAVIRGGLLRGDGGAWAIASNGDETIRRAPRESSPASSEGTPDDPSMASIAETASSGNAATGTDAVRAQAEPAATEAPPALLVDEESETDRGQMRKSDFLRQLRVAVCAAVDEGLSGTGRTSQDCPWIDHWLGYYDGRNASQVETSLHRFAPESRTVTTAADYIPIIAARVRRSAETYATTGEVTGVPDEMAGAIPGGGVLAAFGGLFFKARAGGARRADPIAVRAQLGTGQPLPGLVRTRMESAFGASFSDVRLHTDATAARLSDRLNARAFTLGQHVAFGGGEFRPGTLVGDALIAHELAHVMQQRGGSHRPTHGERETVSLEQDADRASHAALHSSLGMPATASSRLRTGLRLQRCSKDKPKPVARDPALDPQLLKDFAAKFADAARHIRESPDAIALVLEADAAGVRFGGYAEDGPLHDTWPYASGNAVYVPRARTDAVVAMSDFLFELNNAIRAPRYQALATEARKGAAGTLTARTYARQVVEQEVEGMLRLGRIWFEMRENFTGAQRDRYDPDFYQSEYNDFRAGRKTKDDIVNDVLRRVYTTGVDRGKTVEQYYMDQYASMSGGR